MLFSIRITQTSINVKASLQRRIELGMFSTEGSHHGTACWDRLDSGSG